MRSRRDNPLRFECAHPCPVRASLPLLPQAVEPTLPAKAREAAVSHWRGWCNLAGLFLLLSLLRPCFPPSQPYQRKETT